MTEPGAAYIVRRPAGSHSDFIIYVDESGDHSLESIDPEYPVFVLSFCIFRKNDYVTRVTPAIRQLKFATFGHDMVVLHESDIRRKRGVFSQLSREPREAFLNRSTDRSASRYCAPGRKTGRQCWRTSSTGTRRGTRWAWV